MIAKHIVLEGVNGSGKTTVMKWTVKEAKARGMSPIFIKTPSKKNETACRDTFNPDKIGLAKVNALDKAEASIKAFIMTREGFDVFQDRGIISAFMYNGFDGISFNDTTDYIAHETQQILNNPSHLNQLINEVAQEQIEQGYMPKYLYKGDVANLQDDIHEVITAHGLIMPDYVVSLVPYPELIKETFNRRSEQGQQADNYEQNSQRELDVFLKAFASYSHLGGKAKLINSLYGKQAHEYLPYPKDTATFFGEASQYTANMILDSVQTAPGHQA